MSIAKSKEKLLEHTLTSFFYDLAKAISIGTLNTALCNTILAVDGKVAEITYCDERLKDWAREFAEQLMDYQTKFTREQLDSMGFPKTVAYGERVGKPWTKAKKE